jgi:hypothetical protein
VQTAPRPFHSSAAKAADVESSWVRPEGRTQPKQ